MIRFKFDGEVIATAYAVAALMGMLFFFLAGFPEQKVWMGAIWAATFVTLVIPGMAMLQMIEQIKRERRKRKF